MGVKEQLRRAIELMINQALAESKFDRTLKGRIKSVGTNNVYTVTIGSRDYPISDSKTHTVGEFVRVMIPQNDYDDMFILQ